MKFIPVIGAALTSIDDDDFDRVAEYKWRIGPAQTYPQAHKAGKSMFLHRFILGEIPKGYVVDHIDRDPFNNVKANLRICTQRQNTMNQRGSRSGSSCFKGVQWRGDVGKWYARITINRKEIFIGAFCDEVAAARAYDKAALAHFGEFAFLNNPPAASEGQAA